MTQFRHTAAWIDLKNLTHNYSIFRSLLPSNAFFCPMVKANAYGHGDIQVALFLEQNFGHGYFGVSLIEEGLKLRNAGVKSDILVFGLFETGARELLDARLTPVLSTFQQLSAINSAAKNSTKKSIDGPIPVHIKIDTGMGRLGFSVDEISKVLDFLKSSKHLLTQGILTHLHSAEDAIEPEGATQDQLRIFSELVPAFASWSPIIHAWNTAALVALPKNELAIYGARPGLGLYGVSTTKHMLPLKPVMSLRSAIAKINYLKSGQTVSYGGTWKAPKGAIIGVIPIGYADGVHRILSNVGQVLIKGKRAPIVGRVCMDYVMVDLSQVGGDLLNQEVTFFGSDRDGLELSALEVAEHAQTAPWEVLTSVSERVPRLFIEKDAR